MTHQIDLHALANMPGFGSAKSHLRKAGLWDEHAGLPEKKFKVKVSYTIRHEDTEVVDVAARSEAEAEEKACDKIEKEHDYDVEFDEVEVVK